MSTAGETFPSDISSWCFSSPGISHSSTLGAYTFSATDHIEERHAPTSYNSNSAEYQVYTKGTRPKAHAASLGLAGELQY